MISFASLTARNQILFDIGSSYTRVSFNGALLFFEPSCIAIHKKTDAVLAVGAKAAALLGKTPANIEVVFPIRAGVVASEQYAIRLIDAIMQQYVPMDIMASLLGYQGMASVPSRLSPVNVYIWQRVFQKAGLSTVTFIENARAVYAQIAGPKALTHSVCVLDIGGQKSDIAVLSASEVVAAQTFDSGGVECTEIIQDTLLEKETFVIGWQSAEQCKREVASLQIKRGKEKKIVIRGKDAHHHVAKTLQVQSSMFQEQLEFYAHTLLQGVQQFFSIVPPELAASTLERGMYLSGGGSQLDGLQEYLQEGLKTEIIMLQEPQLAAIKGLMSLQK